VIGPPQLIDMGQGGAMARCLMTEEIRLAKSLSHEEDQWLFYWEPDVFGLDPYKFEWRLENDWHFLMYSDGQLVSHVGVVEEVVTVAEQQVTVAGIAAVVTLPKAQGKGYAHKLLKEATTFMCRELKVAFGLLFCRPVLVSFYEPLGWQLVQEPVIIEQPSGKATAPVPVMVLPCRGQSWPSGTVKIASWPW